MSTIVLGFGKSGISAMRLLLGKGQDVTMYDTRKDIEVPDDISKAKSKYDIKVYAGEDIDVSAYDLAVISPGVDPETEIVRKLKDAGAEIISELELAYRHAKGKFIAITGTNGKTTTTTLAGEIFKNAGFDVRICGNIGRPVSESLENSNEDTYFVTEVSSFQLEAISKFKPFISIILNITEDHLDRHKTMENYIAAKCRVFENQDERDSLIYNTDDEGVAKCAHGSQALKYAISLKNPQKNGAYLKDGKLILAIDGRTQVLCDAKDVNLFGEHNIQNILAASLAALLAGASIDSIGNTVKKFKAVEHRLEYVDTACGVKYINDSKGTNVDASTIAIKALPGGIHLIAGGYDKGADFSEFARGFDGKVKALYLFGATKERFEKEVKHAGFEGRISVCNTLRECVEKASSSAASGDIVLLSPASASWDMYKSFEERGDEFKELVVELKERVKI